MRWGIAILAAVLVFWGISMERTYAWLGQASALALAKQQRGLHPLSADFAAPHQGDSRLLLIGQKAFGAVATPGLGGLNLAPQQSMIDVRIHFFGASLSPLDVTHAQIKTAAGAPDDVSFALIMHASASDPGWISASPLNANESIRLDQLSWLREPERTKAVAWQDLPAIAYVRLYIHAPKKSAILLQALEFSLTAPLTATTPNASRPETLLLSAQQQRGQAGQWPQVRYRGLWLDQSLSLIAGLSLLVFVALLRRRKKPMARLAAMLVMFAPLLAVLWGDRQLEAAFIDTPALGLLKQPIGACFAAFLIMLAVHLYVNRDTGNLLLDQYPGDSAAWRSAAVASACLALVLILAFGFRGSEHSVKLILSYLLFALAQQWLLQKIVLQGCLRAGIGDSRALFISASLFALWHTPNFALMVLCFGAGLLWCTLYLRHPRLLPLACAHAVLGWLALATVPQTWLRCADVGIRFFA
jgi:hypothetical protein